MLRALVLTSVLLAGCGGGDDAPLVGGGYTPPTGTPDPCATAAPGCKCTDVGKSTTCRATRVSGTYVSCSTGSMTCTAAGVWGECIGDRVWDPDAAVANDAAADAPAGD